MVVSAKSRLVHYPNHGFSVKKSKGSDILWCDPCRQEVDFHRTSVIDRHISSVKHVKNKDGWTAQPSIPSTFQNAENISDQWQTMVHAFVGAGIPLNVLREGDLRDWLKRNLKNGESLPSVSTLRRRYLVEEGIRDLEESKTICREQPIILVADETPDPKNRKILNVLAKPAIPGSRFRLIRSEILENCTSQRVVQSLVSVATKTLALEANNILCLVSDNARYMMAAGRGLSVFSERYFHTTCWAHVMHLTSEEIRESLGVADQFISCVKQALLKAPNRRQEYYDCMEKQGLSKKLPPVPVLTRWATWFESGAFLFEVFNGLRDWIMALKNDSKAVGTLKSLIDKEDLATQLQTVSQLAGGIVETIRKLESNTMLASDVWILLQTMDHLIEETTGTPSQKLRKYILDEHPAKQFWNEVQFCDPRKIFKFYQETDIWKVPDSLKIFSETPVPAMELTKLKEIIRGFAFPADFKVTEFWIQNSKELPSLSALCLRALSIPPSSAEVERSFSALKRLLSSRRLNFLEENIDLHLRLQYNVSKNISEDSEDEEE